MKCCMVTRFLENFMVPVSATGNTLTKAALIVVIYWAFQVQAITRDPLFACKVGTMLKIVYIREILKKEKLVKNGDQKVRSGD